MGEGSVARGVTMLAIASRQFGPGSQPTQQMQITHTRAVTSTSLTR